MGTESDDGTAAFTRSLASLKREGSNLLVVGAGSDEAHGELCTRLLGDTVGDRRRAFVSTERGGCVPAEYRRGDAERLSYELATRSAAAAASPSSGPDLPSATVRDLSSLGEAIARTIDEIDTEVGGLAPAQFRLCLDSLRPLLEEHTEKQLFRFLHAVANDVRAADGMAHYHLPLAYDTSTVRTLEPLFDAVIEVRDGEDGPQQRWHLTEDAVETDWLPL